MWRTVLSIAIFSIASCGLPAWSEASFEEVKAAWRPSDTLILDRQGEVLQRMRTEATVRRGQWLALTDISPALRTALVRSEDKRFDEHHGIDWQAVWAAAWANLWNRQTRGASTLTMQLAGLLDDELKRQPGGRSALQKVRQAVSASELERHWRKDQILEAYLNLVPFRGELVGLDALSQTLFGKAAHALDEREAAVAVALVRAPNAAQARVAQRACAVLRSLRPVSGPQDCEALALFTAGALQRRDFEASAGIAPHAARQALRAIARPSVPGPPVAAASHAGAAANATTSSGALAVPAAPATLATTLSAPLQRFAVNTLQQHLRELHGRQVEDGAILVLDNASGQVLAWVGSSGALSRASEVDGVTALRQPGSALKPFLYAQALAQRRITAASLLDDSGTQIQTPGGLYIPQNYDHRFKGWVSVRTALGASLNVPAVRTLVMVSPNAFHRQLLQLGLPLEETGDYYGYSLALGSAEVSLLTLTNAYRALANGGQFGVATLLPGVQATRRTVLDARAAFIVGDILSDPLARARTFGSDSVLRTRFWSAVKTGTSKDMRDNWALGWSQAYTVGVWVGNASGEPMHNVSGASGAAPIWADVMGYLHANHPSPAPAAPAGVLRRPVRFATASAAAPAPEARREEWFIEGTEQALFTLYNVAYDTDYIRAEGKFGLKTSGMPRARITAPANGTLIALDPDIPPVHQRVSFTATGAALRWRINGRVVARGPAMQWLPWPGQHRVEIIDGRNQTLDGIRLEVRGAGLRAVAAAAPATTAPRP